MKAKLLTPLRFLFLFVFLVAPLVSAQQTARSTPAVSVAPAEAAYVRVAVDFFPRTTPLGQPLTPNFTGSEPIRIYWFAHVNGRQVEIVEARGLRSYTPPAPGWILCWGENDHYGSTANGNLLPYGTQYLGNNLFAPFVATVMGVPTRWTLVQ